MKVVFRDNDGGDGGYGGRAGKLLRGNYEGARAALNELEDEALHTSYWGVGHAARLRVCQSCKERLIVPLLRLHRIDRADEEGFLSGKIDCPKCAKRMTVVASVGNTFERKWSLGLIDLLSQKGGVVADLNIVMGKDRWSVVREVERINFPDGSCTIPPEHPHQEHLGIMFQAKRLWREHLFSEEDMTSWRGALMNYIKTSTGDDSIF